MSGILDKKNIFLLTFVAVCFYAILKDSYYFGYADQIILLIKGMAHADHKLFLNDWFVAKVPQPHIIFDYAVEKLYGIHLLKLGMIVLWVLSLLAYAGGLYLIWKAFFQDNIKILYIAVILTVLAPIMTLGSATPLLNWTIPHVMGGCLSILALGFLANKEIKWAVLLLPAVTLAHFHHAANLIVIVIAYLIVFKSPNNSLKSRVIKNVLFSVVIAGCLGVIYYLASSQGLTSNGDAFQNICKNYVSYHCFSRYWSWTAFLTIFPIAGSGYIFIKKSPKLAFVIVGLPMAGLLLGIFCDFFQIPYLGWFVRRVFINRLMALLYPFIALGLAAGIAESVKNTGKYSVYQFILFTGFTVLWIAGGLVSELFHINNFFRVAVFFDAWILAAWFLYKNPDFIKTGDKKINLLKTGLALWMILQLLWVLFNPEMRLYQELLVAGFIAVILIFPLERKWKPLHITANLYIVIYIAMLPGIIPHKDIKDREKMGDAIYHLTKPGDIIIANPDIIWIRYNSRRAVIVDAKGIPYGNPYFHEWETRIFNVYDFYDELSQREPLALETLELLIKKYKASHLLLTSGQVNRFKEICNEKFHFRSVGKYQGTEYFLNDTAVFKGKPAKCSAKNYNANRLQSDKTGQRYYTIGKNMKSSDFLATGWSKPEPTHQWTYGKNAEIEFYLDKSLPKVTSYQLKLKPFLTIRQQRVFVSINGTPIGVMLLEDRNEKSLVFKSGLLIKNGKNVIEFTMPDARRPGNGDHRVLSFALGEVGVYKADSGTE